VLGAKLSLSEWSDCIYWLQEYVYKFNYDSDGGVTVDLTTNGKPVEKSNKKKPVSMLTVPNLVQIQCTDCA